VRLLRSFADFDRLEVLTKIEGFFINDTPLRVGVGREPPLGSAVDLAVIRMRVAGRTLPYIPGSSLKGVLRSTAEAILRARGERVHHPWDFEAVERERMSNNYCLICGIFGNTALASHIRVYDAYPEGEPVVVVKQGVGLNRDFGGAHPHVLYSEELVAPGTRWGFRMDIINIRVYPEPGDERGRLLRELIGLLAQGIIQVGARRSVGCGLIRLVEGRYRVYEVRDGRLVKIAEGKVIRHG